MDRYIFVFREGEQSLDPIFSWVKNLLQDGDSSTQSKSEEKQLLKWIPVAQKFSQVCCLSSICQWIELESLIQHMKDKTSLGHDDVQKQTLETCLHDTADSIPCAGCSVQMYIFLHSDDLETEESFCRLAGAVMRLVKWHHVRTTVVKMESELSAFGHQLVGLTNGKVESVKECPRSMSISWSGEVSVMDEVLKDGITFPGFYIPDPIWVEIVKQRYRPTSSEKPNRRIRGQKDQVETLPSQHQDQTVCGHTIEVLQEIDLRTFPLFLLTPWTFDLHCFSDATDKSHDLVDYIHGMPCTGLVARLRVYQMSGDVVQCGVTSHLSTSAWREYILDGSPDLHVGHMPSMYEYLHCLVLPSPSLPQSSQTSSAKTGGCLRVRVLSTAKELARNILSVAKRPVSNSSLEHAGRNRRQSDCVGTKTGARRVKEEPSDASQDWITSLPVFKVEDVFKALQTISLNKQEVKSEPGSSPQPTLLEDVLKEMSTNGCTLGNLLEGVGVEDTKEWTSEAVKGLEDCPEWIALASEAPGGHGTKKDNSSINSGPPSTATTLSKQKSFEKVGSKEFSIDHVISLFKEDNYNRSETKLDTNPFRRFDGSVDKSWRQHDMYHYYTEEDYDSDNKYARIRDQGDFQDTQSSFVTPKKKASKQFRAILPTRSSPRSKLFSRNLSSSHSPQKLTDHSTSTFKHPQSLHGSSSSIQRKRPHSSLTPDYTNPQLSRHSSVNSSGGGGSSSSQSRKRLPSSSFTPEMDQPKSSYASTSNSQRKRLTPDLERSQSSHGSTSSFPRKRPASSSFTPEYELSRPFKFSRTSTPSPSQMPSSDFEPVGETSPFSNNPFSSPSFKRVPFTTVLDVPESGVRRSPRKLPGSQSVFAKSLKHSKPIESSQKSENPGPSNTRHKTESTPTETSQKMKRSERHMMRLKSIIAKVLTEKGVERDNPIYQACSKNLLNVSIVLLKSLPNSRNLTDEMKSVVYGQVQQIINLEKRRSGIAL